MYERGGLLHFNLAVQIGRDQRTTVGLRRRGGEDSRLQTGCMDGGGGGCSDGRGTCEARCHGRTGFLVNLALKNETARFRSIRRVATRRVRDSLGRWHRLVVGRWRIRLEKEETDGGETEGTAREQEQEVAWISWEKKGSKEREEEGTKAKGGEGKCGCGASMLRPVESGCFDGSGESQTATKASEEGEEAKQGNGASSIVVSDMERKVADGQKTGAYEDSRPGATVVNEQTDGDAHQIHAQVSRKANEIALGSRKLQLLSELGGPCRVDILRGARLAADGRR